MKDTAALENSFTPDPRQFGLTEDFIYVEKAWGSLFYKHLGKLNKTGAKQICSQYGDSVHLPIPRFKDENDFYTNFIDENYGLIFHLMLTTILSKVIMAMYSCDFFIP